MDYDVTWKNPGRSQLDALEFVCKQLGVRVPKEDGPLTHHFFVGQEAVGRALMVDAGVAYKSGMSVYDYAELVLLAKNSLWFSEAKNSAYPVCKFIVDVVNLGYEDGKWWNAERLDQSYVETNKRKLFTLKLLFKKGSYPFISQGFIPVIDLILGKKWQSEYVDSLRKSQPYQSSKCIKPDCQNLVAPIGIEPKGTDHKNYRGTGACQKGHNGYACQKCNTPHSYVTKIGKGHLQYAKKETG